MAESLLMFEHCEETEFCTEYYYFCPYQMLAGRSNSLPAARDPRMPLEILACRCGSLPHAMITGVNNSDLDRTLLIRPKNTCK